mmetsp:Transcript_54977/g.169417  ORF Transcript_54977/g.169417 Transcript_54977/m.169417 type:complete len:227 (+) Transcript_54977:3-683(+)
MPSLVEHGEAAAADVLLHRLVVVDDAPVPRPQREDADLVRASADLAEGAHHARRPLVLAFDVLRRREALGEHGLVLEVLELHDERAVVREVAEATDEAVRLHDLRDALRLVRRRDDHKALPLVLCLAHAVAEVVDSAGDAVERRHAVRLAALDLHAVGVLRRRVLVRPVVQRVLPLVLEENARERVRRELRRVLDARQVGQAPAVLRIAREGMQRAPHLGGVDAAA